MQSEEDRDRQAEFVCRVDCDVERAIVDAALRTLHPVNYTRSVGAGRSFAANRYARVGEQPFDPVQSLCPALT
ncbi:MAG: hypothetical protein WAU45_23960 [Blastocatellia bacterium]